MARTLEDISTQNEDSPQGGSGEVCQKASKDLSDILLGDDILQRLKQGEEVIREGLIFEFDSSAYFNDIIIKYNDKDFTLFVSNLKGISLKEIKRRIELLVKLETYGVLLDYAYGVIDMF